MEQKFFKLQFNGQKQFLALQKTHILFLAPAADDSWLFEVPGPRESDALWATAYTPYIHTNTYTKNINEWLFVILFS